MHPTPTGRRPQNAGLFSSKGFCLITSNPVIKKQIKVYFCNNLAWGWGTASHSSVRGM